MGVTGGSARRLALGVWSCALLALAAGAAPDSWLSSIGWGLQSKMSGVLEMATTVNYSTPVINTTYIASVEFDMRAMGPVYNNTHRVIDIIAEKQAYPQGMVEVSDGHVELTMSVREDWRVLLGHYAGPLAVVTVAALLVAALPLAGVFWCCCYWWRSKRRRPFDRKYDACLKGLLAIVLIGLLTLFLFGVVVSFATDSQVESGAAEAPGALRAGVHDTRAFLNATQAHARHLLVNNYRELERKLSALLTTSGLTISMQLSEFSRAVSVTTLNAMVEALDGVQADLRSVRAHTTSLRSNAERLNTVLRSVKAQLLTTLARCNQPACVRLQEKHKIGQLDTEIHYSQMPDVTELLNNVTQLLESNIKAEVAEGQAVFRDIQREIQRSVDEHIPSLQDELTQTGARLERVADEISWLAGNASARVGSAGALADRLQAAHARYGPYRRYLGLGAAIALLAITLVLTWGLLCGVCGKRPDVYGASDCCNKGAGSKCLLCGMALMFVVGGAVSLVLALYFAAGLAAQRALCDPLTEPRDNRVWADVERFVELEALLFNERADPGFNLTYVITRCHTNHTVYESLQLHRRYDLRAVRARTGAALARRVGELRARYPPPAPHLTILKPSAREKLLQLANTGLSDFDFDRILHALETNITSLGLENLSQQLELTARSLEGRAGWEDVAGSLRNASGRLARTQAVIVAALLSDAAALNATATRLRDSLRFNHSSLKAAIAYLMHETAQAETFLNTQGPDLIQNMTAEFGVTVAGLVDAYLARVVVAAEREVGRCGPLSNAFNATRDAACHKILMPINGYWMALGWCVLLMVPLLVVAQRLAKLYTHLDPYPGPLVEAEYLYDAYADRDNVPLANGSKRSTLDIEGKIAEWRERSQPSAPPEHECADAVDGGVAGGGGGEGARTALVLSGQDVVCALVPHPAALIDDLKTRLPPAKDEDNESGIHDADAYKAEKRSGREVRRGAGPSGGGGGGGAGAARAPAALPPAPDAHVARRYNDMAPKHWEEGPPRYHGPTEYERPPPYYYPGPADRQ